LRFIFIFCVVLQALGPLPAESGPAPNDSGLTEASLSNTPHAHNHGAGKGLAPVKQPIQGNDTSSHVEPSGILPRLPGIRSLTLEEYTEFQTSFLADLYAGIVSGVVTGMIVGLVVLVLEKGFEKRRYTKSLQRELAIFKEELRYNADNTVLFSLHNITSLPDAISLVRETLRRNPIDIWHDVLKNERSFIDILKSFQDALHLYSKAAAELDQRLWKAIRRQTQTEGALSVNDPPRYIYFMGRTLGLGDATIAPIMDLGVVKGGIIGGSAKQSYERLRSDPELQELASGYRSKKEQLELTFQSLRGRLGLSESSDAYE